MPPSAIVHDARGDTREATQPKCRVLQMRIRRRNCERLH